MFDLFTGNGKCSQVALTLSLSHWPTLPCSPDAFAPLKILTTNPQHQTTMSSAALKASSAVSGLIAKTTHLTNAAVYWSKVTFDLGKIVWKREQMNPPSVEQFQQVYQKAFKWLQSPQQQKEWLQKVAQIKPTKDTIAKGTYYGVQLAAFYSVGEMIGRRLISGYPKPHHEHH